MESEPELKTLIRRLTAEHELDLVLVHHASCIMHHASCIMHHATAPAWWWLQKILITTKPQVNKPQVMGVMRR